MINVPRLAPWNIDPSKLGSTIAAIRAAISAGRNQAPVSFSPSPLVGRYDGLESSIQQVIRDIREALRQREGKVSSGTWLQPNESMDGLAAVINSIRGAWRDRVIATIDASHWATLARLMQEPSPNLLAMLNRQRDENSHSDILRWLLSPRNAPNISLAVLSELISRLESADEWASRMKSAIRADCLSVRREVRLGPETTDPSAADRIDLLVTGPGFALAVENKIWSAEHDHQTATYARWLAALPAETLTAGIFLTPRGHPAASPVFRPLSYLELTKCLLVAAAEQGITATERAVLAGYIKSLADHVLRNELRVAPPDKDTT
jgi:hypothetical protein